MLKLKRDNAAHDASGLVALIAVAGFIRWVGEVPRETALGTLFPPVMPSSLFLLGLVALALRELSIERGRRVRYFVSVVAFVITCVALSRLGAEYGLISRQTVDLLLLGSLFHPAPPSVATGAGYLLISGALALAAADGPLARRLSRACAAMTAGITSVALVGIAATLLFDDELSLVPGMTLPVALALFVASTGLLTMRAPVGDGAPAGDADTPGMLVIRRLVPMAILLPLAVGWLQALGRRAGWFERLEGEGALVIGVIVASLVLILWTASKLDQMNVSRSRAEQRADTQQLWLEITLVNIGEAVITVNVETKIGFLNPAAESLLNVRADAVVGRKIAEVVMLVDEETGVPADCPIDQALAQQQPVALDGRPALRRPDGSLQPLEVTATPIRDGGSRIVGGVLVLRDISVHRARERAEREAYAALDRRVAERTRALDRTTSVLQESTALLRTIAETTPEQIIAKGRDGRIMMVNPAALKSMALSRAQVIGRKEEELFADSDEIRRIAQSDRQVIETGRPLVVEERRKTSIGERILLVTKSPLRDARGEVVGLVGVSKDITEHKRAHQELEQLLDAEHRLRGEAERASRAKDEFLAIVSHELRSPLNSLKGWAQVLNGVAVPDPALLGRASEAIKRNVDHQTRLIDDLLNTSRIISGKLDLNCERINLVDAAISTLETFRAPALEKNVGLRFESERDVVSVFADFDRMQQVLSNLLWNALKFTPEGGCVRVAVEVVDKSVELSVSDSGIGIDAGFLPHVFDRFSQADTSMTRSYAGLGIGLALVRNLVEMQGGTARAHSEGPGCGSIFTVALPRLADSEFPSEHGLQGCVPQRRLEGVAILLLDDDSDARDFMQVILSKAGARVQTFDSGGKLLGMLHGTGAIPGSTVLLLDIAMPGDSGFDVLQLVRQIGRAQYLPAIAVTALAHLDSKRFAAAGFQASVSKPVDERILVDTITSVLDARAANPRRNARVG